MPFNNINNNNANNSSESEYVSPSNYDDEPTNASFDSSSSDDSYSDDTYDSNDSSDYGDGDIVFNPDSRYLITYEFYNSKLHGNRACDGMLLVNKTFKNTNYFRTSYIQLFYEHNKELAARLRWRGGSRLKHPFIRNYINILDNSATAQVQIAQCIQLDSGEQTAVLKTFYLRIIQRAWKKRFAIRVQMEQRKRIPENILYRVRHGSWPQCCLNLPTIRGILANLC
jgi:hypothetical protein